MATRTLGTSSWAGPRTRRTLFVSPPRDSLHSSAYSVTSPLSSHGLDSCLMFHLLTTGSERARGSGTQLTTRFRRLFAGKGWQPTWDAPLLHHINLVRRFGCQPGTSECACPARSLVPDTLAPSLSITIRSIQSLTNSDYLLNTEFTPPSMCYFSNHTLLQFLSLQSLARQVDLRSRLWGGYCHSQVFTPVNPSAPPHMNTSHTHLQLLCTFIKLASKAHTSPHSSVRSRLYVKDMRHVTWGWVISDGI